MTDVYLALGSNVGDSRGHIKAAIKLLEASVHDIKQAPIYLSRPVGYTEQPDFLNTAVRGRTDLKPEDLLAFIKIVEDKVGRAKTFRFGPREIDIDIIFYDDLKLQSADPELIIPHPAFRERDFVLRPLCDLEPHLVDPSTGRTVRQLLDSLPAEHRSITKQVD